jgi:opacity protein-like surface antigen
MRHALRLLALAILLVTLASPAYAAHMRIAPLQTSLTGDTDGDGRLDTVTVITTGIQVVHPATGRTTFYPYSGSFSLSSLNNTDAVAGVEVIVIWAGSAGTNGIDVSQTFQESGIRAALPVCAIRIADTRLSALMFLNRQLSAPAARARRT